GLTSTTLGGNTPVVGTGLWSQLSGPGSATFSSPSSGNSTATASAYGSYVFRWTITSGTCTSSADIQVVFWQTPTTANAGPNQNLCESTTATLAGNTPTVGTGVWTLVSGTGTITTPSSPTSGVTGLGYGPTVFQWTISNGACTVSSSTV